MTEKNDPLTSLFSDNAKAVDRQRVADFMRPYISIDPATKEVGFLPSVYSLKTNTDKLEVVLMSAKVSSLLFSKPDGMTQGEIITLEMMPSGSVKSSLNSLSSSKKIKQDSEGRYYVPNYRVDEVIKSHTLKA